MTTVIGKSQLYLGDKQVCEDLTNIYAAHHTHDLQIVSEYAYDELAGFTEIETILEDKTK